MIGRGWLLAVLALLLAGCASVPDSGPIQRTDPGVQSAQQQEFIRALARPPRPGMTTTQVVQGFLDAASGYDDGHAVARMYLTPEAAAGWVPDAGTRVYANGSQLLTQRGEAGVDLTATQIATISPRGEYVPDSPTLSMSVAFALTQVDGQWRISEAPPGLLLTRSDVDRSLREVATYYIVPPGDVLAPNLLAVANSRRDLPTYLVQSLLRGPSQWLSPAVTTAFPEGTELTRDVEVLNGVATVNLSRQAAQTDEKTRQQLSAQLVWTLRQVDGVSGIRIVVDGQPIEVPPEGDIQRRDAWSSYNPDVLDDTAPAYFERAGRIQRFDGVASTPVAGAGGSGDPPVSHPLVGISQDTLTATSTFGSEVLRAEMRAGAPWNRVVRFADTNGGSVDRVGWLWLPAGTSGVKVVGLPGVTTRRAPVPGSVRSVQVSRDGSRAVLMVARGGVRQAYLVVVDRTKGIPLLRNAQLLPSAPVRDASWMSASRIALLVRDPGTPAQVMLLGLAKYDARMVGAPSRVATVAAAPGRPLLASSRDARIWEFRGLSWTPIALGRSPRYPG